MSAGAVPWFSGICDRCDRPRRLRPMLVCNVELRVCGDCANEVACREEDARRGSAS